MSLASLNNNSWNNGHTIRRKQEDAKKNVLAFNKSSSLSMVGALPPRDWQSKEPPGVVRAVSIEGLI